MKKLLSLTTLLIIAFSSSVLFSGPAFALLLQPGMIVPYQDSDDPVIFAEAQKPAVKLSAASPDKNLTKETPSRSQGPDARFIISTAMELLGKPYRYGGGGPNSFDCSGFTMYVFGLAGIGMTHLASDQASLGVHVDKDQLLPGDLLFFSYKGGKTISHVGIYIGDGKFIHASSSACKVVITDLESGYYDHNYKGARRVLR